MIESQPTRRDFLGTGLQLTALAAVFLTGCGGSVYSGGSGGPAKASTGNIVVPNGLAESDLSIVGLGQVSGVKGGQFQTLIASDAPSFVLAVHGPSGKVIGMAIFDPADTIRTINSTSDAVALLFVALDGNALPSDGRKSLLDLIKRHSETATLATVIQGLLNSDPYTLESANSTLQSALATAAAAIASAPPMHRSGVESPQAGLPTMMLIEPSNEVDGLTVVQSANNLAYEVQNARRRNGLMYTYLVAHVDGQGNRVDITPQQVGNALEIPATNSLLNLSSGWHPKTSPSVPLKLQGQDLKSIYELISLNVVYGANDPLIFGLNRYAGVVDQWKSDVRNLHAIMALSYVSGIMFDAIGIGGLTLGIAELTATITKLTPVSSDLVSLLTGAQDGYALIPLTKQVIQKFLTGSFLSPDGVKAFQPLLAKAEGQVAKDLAIGQASSSVYVAMRAALRIFLAVGAIGLAADLVAVAKDTSTGERGDLFTVTLFEPKVALSPANGEYTPGVDLTIQALAPGVPASHLSFHWKLSGSNLANLSDGTNVGAEFTSSSKLVTLGTTPSTQGSLTVTVTAMDTTTSTVLGTASAVYTAGSAAIYTSVLQPFGASGLYPQGGGYAVVYLPVTLASSARKVHIAGSHDLYGTISYDINVPAKSSTIPHTTPVVAQQLIGGTAGVNNGTIINIQFVGAPGYGNLIEDQSIVWWNYGDEAWLILAVRTWDNRGPGAGADGNSGDALTTALGFSAKWHMTAT